MGGREDSAPQLSKCSVFVTPIDAYEREQDDDNIRIEQKRKHNRITW
jgi:hypothetical protein